MSVYEPWYTDTSMKALVREKQKAIALRRKGASYNEILKEVSVAKSSLSLWLKDLPLTKSEKQVLRKRVDSNISHGRIKSAAANRKHKFDRQQQYLIEASSEFKRHDKDPLFHTGISLYWAEGAKRNDMFHFMNSDQAMIIVFLQWLETYTEYRREDLGYRLYLHQPFIRDNWEQWWAKKLGVSQTQFKKTIIKLSNLQVEKRPNYKGCLRVEVPRSVKLLIKMKFWINMQVEYYNKR
jgi:hypothetical protein